MKKLRIGMFTWESLYSIRVGGISPHVSELSDALAAEGHEVHLFTRNRENKDELMGMRNYKGCSVTKLIGKGYLIFGKVVESPFEVDELIRVAAAEISLF